MLTNMSYRYFFVMTFANAEIVGIEPRSVNVPNYFRSIGDMQILREMEKKVLIQRCPFFRIQELTCWIRMFHCFSMS